MQGLHGRIEPKGASWLCFKQPTATKAVSVGSFRLCSEQPAATEPESVGSFPAVL
jgi:hypothetical protein